MQKREEREFLPLLTYQNPVQNKMRPRSGGGARGGDSPPRVGSNALNALLGKAFSERSEDFSAVERRESNGICQAVGKVLGLFDSLTGTVRWTVPVGFAGSAVIPPRCPDRTATAGRPRAEAGASGGGWSAGGRRGRDGAGGGLPPADAGAGPEAPGLPV